jgi:hypothetical protein
MDKRYISIKEVIGVIWKGRMLSLICALILAGVTLVGSFIYENSVETVSTVVALEWNGLTEGEYPDGSRFDYQNMFELYVLSAAKGNVDVSVDDLRENMTVTPVQPNDVLAIVENALQNGEKISYFASEYVIQLDVGKAGITVEQGRQILNNVIDEYRLDFEKKYVQTASILDFTESSYNDLDYVEIQLLFKSQLDAIHDGMIAQVDAVGNYYGTNYSFNDILVREEFIRSTSYSSLSSTITRFSLTNDLDALLSKLIFQKEEKEAELAVATAKRDRIETLLTNYTGGTSTIIIPGSTDEDQIVIDTYYKELVEKQIDAEVEVATLTEDVATLQTMYDRFNGDDPLFLVTPQEQTSAMADADYMIPRINTALKELVADTNEVLLEYNTNLVSGQIAPLMAPQQERNVPLVLFTAVGFIVGAAVGTAVALYKHDWE